MCLEADLLNTLQQAKIIRQKIMLLFLLVMYSTLMASMKIDLSLSGS